MSEINYTLPVIPLRGMTVLPDMIIHFDVSRKRSVQALEAAMVEEQNIFLVSQLDPETDHPGRKDLYDMGTVAKIKQLVKLPQDTVRVLVEGMFRARMDRLVSEQPYLSAEVTIFQDEDHPDEIHGAAMVRYLRKELAAYASVNNQFSPELVRKLENEEDPVKLMNQMAINIPMDYKVRQQLLEAVDIQERFETLISLMDREVDIIRINREIQAKVKERVDKSQREYVLREQLRVIREELGENNLMSEAEEFEHALKKLKADKSVKARIAKEIDRFKATGNNPSENGVLRGYIETLLDMPWNKAGKDNPDTKKAEAILRADHYGLEKVKERIVEYLAVRHLAKKGETPILCLVGPPGTGKTSIGRSVARALNKEYVRISLGGVHDEAEIRGHRKTYVGAMPGRIVEGLRQAGVSNPLMLLDEIDKVSSDYKGDTSSALLEVLDGEQNVKFRDHYVETPIDLSQVMFIATANTTQTIPGPLLDRMEVIEVNSYTENEKFHIAKDYLVPKQLERNGLDSRQVTFSDKALVRMIHNYTREAGVRNLERRIGDVCRKAAREFLENRKTAIRVTEGTLEKYLGKEKITFENANEQDEVGIVRGLAWTSVGGDTLQIEVNVMPGKGNLLMTGQLGDVMKESAQTALTYVRSIAPGYEVADDYFEKHDLHIHIPEGAVPKDGPSAGITMATAMLSAVTGRPVRCKVAMTGEITLRGRVLPIGGLKEKILAAKMAHIEKVLVPEKNRPDMAELSKEITRGLQIVYVRQMEDVLKEALV